jgi:secondary thiamine-phosphate synthase enzyme
MIVNHLLRRRSDPGISITNLTAEVRQKLVASGIHNGQALLFSRHTTTALAINEDEERLLEDIKVYLNRLAPETAMPVAGGGSHRYLHNDLDQRPNIPADEPLNAHSHLMAITLSQSEVIPIVDGELALGTYQSILLFDLDGPRDRTVLLQLWGEAETK